MSKKTLHHRLEGQIAAEIQRLRHGDSRYNLILLAAVLAGLITVLILPDRPWPAGPFATLVVGWEVRAWIDRRADALEARLEEMRGHELTRYRLYMRSGRPGPPPRLR